MNRITKLLISNIHHQAGMIWVSGHKLASAVSNAGGLGLIGGSMYPEVLREHIQKCKKDSKPWSECSYVVSQH
jgi:enoyl-[acyl-carrier protein] reductase II